MTEPESFPDAPARRPGEGGSKPADEKLEREAINPADFVVSIEDLRRTREMRGGDHAGVVLSLAGVLRALFGAAGPSRRRTRPSSLRSRMMTTRTAGKEPGLT